MSNMLRGAVIGSPVEHSLSPLLHREAFAFLGIDGQYDRREIQLESLNEFFISSSQDFDYLSITIPLK